MSRIVLALLGATLLATSAHAAPIEFAPAAEGSRELELVRALLPDAGSMRVAVVDVDADGTGEVVARPDCADDASTCRTVMFRHDGADWRRVLDVQTGPVELVAPEFGATRSILTASGRWNWDGAGYALALGEGDGLQFRVADDKYQQTLANQFGEGALQLVSTSDARVEISRAEPATGRQVVVARLVGRGVCGMTLGCPIRVMSVEDGTYRTLLATSGEGQVSLSRSIREGWRDFSIQRPDRSVALFGWTGQSYAAAAK